MAYTFTHNQKNDVPVFGNDWRDPRQDELDKLAIQADKNKALDHHL